MKTTSPTDPSDIEGLVAEHVARCRFEQLPPAAVAAAKRSLVDVFGAMIAGRAAAGIDAMIDLVRGWGGAPQARVLGARLRAPAPLAAWCNGAMARALELDDCVDYLPIHPTAMSAPALLAAADASDGLAGRDFLCALALAQDLKIRLGQTVKRNAMQTGRNNPFKIYAAVAGLANAARLTVDETRHALGIASSYAVGDGQCAIDGSMALRVQYGNVAQGAVQAVALARLGVTGARDFLTGRYGYLTAFEPEHELGALTEGLGVEFRGATVSTKPYASCRATHPAIDLARELRARLSGAPRVQRELASITLRVSPEVDGLVGRPQEAKARPATGPAAQFSLQFTVASALLHDGFGLADSGTDALRDRDRLALAARTRVVPEPACRTGSVLGRTVLEAELNDGTVIRLECEQPSGSPQHPVDTNGLQGMLLDCVRFSGLPIENAAVERLIERVQTIESLHDVRCLMESLE
ncbi:MAG: MmgE/PrpD family protein [Burkholderiales bacterium]|nr:MAG: MmgE/PrpD family protein [Burkholderiales bacterium]